MFHDDNDGPPRIGISPAMLNLAHEAWHIGFAALALLLAVLASGHAVLHKRDSRAAIAWVGFVWLVPLLGAVLYFIFGVNRVRHQAALLRSNLERYRAQAAAPECPPEELVRYLPVQAGHLAQLARVVAGVVDRPLVPGNQIEPLLNGDAAYPAMLEAIGQARQTVFFVSYIFDHSKLMLVDGAWVLLGSANWDARSLRLNFEYNVECYDVELARRLDELVETKRKIAHLVSLQEVDDRSLAVRLRDGVARLLTPYL